MTPSGKPSEREAWEAKRRVRRRYDASCQVYDELYSDEQELKYSVALRMLEVGPGDSALDNGCGSGILAATLTRRGSFVVGADLSPGLLMIGRRALWRPMPSFVCCDSDCLPFTDEAFDKVFAITLLQNVPNPLRTIGEMRRVTKPHGRLLITFLKKGFTFEGAEGLLKEAGLKVTSALSQDSLKDYVFLCAKV